MNARSLRYLLVFALASCGGGDGPTDPGPMVVLEPAFEIGATTVYQDNMDAYVDYATMWLSHLTTPAVPMIAPADGGSAVMEIITGRGGTGKALRLNYPGQPQTGDGWNTWATPLAPDLATHYIQYWARITFSAPLTTTLGVKWLEGWHRTTQRIQWHMHWMNSSSACPYTAAGATHLTYWQVMDQSRFSACQGAQPIGPFLENVADGEWHRFTVQYRSNTASGRRDGFARMWIDGEKVVDVSMSACGVTPVGGFKPWCSLDDVQKLAINDGIYFLKLGGIQTTTTPPWTLDIDDLMWWRN